MLTYIAAYAQGYRAKLCAETQAEGLQEQRNRLCHLARRRLKAAAAKDLARRIEGIDDTAPLREMVDLIFDCSVAGEFAAR